MRVVLDANVLISSVISPRGNPARILELWKQKRFDLVVSGPILEEIERVIHYPRIQERYRLPAEQVEHFLGSIAEESILVNPSEEISAVERDPTDNRYLECAMAGEASYIVTGDQHLLELETYRRIVIVNPTAFLAVLALDEQGKNSYG